MARLKTGTIIKRGISRTLTKERQEIVRAQIQTEKLIRRLNDHALGILRFPMTDSQVRTALGLLKKVLPDLQSVELSTGEDEKRFVLVAVPQSQSVEEWVKQYGFQQTRPQETVEGEFTEIPDSD